MKILDLPPLDYRHASEHLYGPWCELWILTQPAAAVRAREGWIVQIGTGTVGREKLLVELDWPGVTILPTKGEVRLSFRARRVARETP